MRSLTVLSICCLAPAIAACSRDARLYPANLQAGTQALHARFTDSGMGSGPIEMTMPDGELLKGEFTTTDTSNYGFGSAFGFAGHAPAVVTTGSLSSVPRQYARRCQSRWPKWNDGALRISRQRHGE